MTAFQVLHRVLEEGAYANLLLASALSDAKEQADPGHRHAFTPQQRAFATAMVYGTLTRLFTIDHILRQTLDRPMEGFHPKVRTILRLGAFQLMYSRTVPASAACDESVRICRRFASQAACGLVNGTLRNIARNLPDISEKDPSLFYSLPPELYGYVKKAAGAIEAPMLAASLLETPPVTLRINRLRTTVSDVINRLSDEGIAAVPGRYAPEAVIPDLAGRPIQATAVYREGLVSVQDEGAMLTTHVVSPEPGERIIDLCAAPGGKSVHMSEFTQDQINLTACDIHENRLSLIRSQAERLGICRIRVMQADATGDQWPDELAGPFDRVLADVPCSGLGLLARKPEIRRNMTHERIVGLLAVQAAILDHAGSLVKPGGILVYSTCTFNPAENDGQIDRFVERTAGTFQREDITDLLPKPLMQFPDIREQAVHGSITLLPHRHATDGFFIARLRRAI